MLKALSRSVIIMFMFDILVFGLASFLSCQLLNIVGVSRIVAVVLTTLTGMVVLYLKANYKIREFNINKKNVYLLFEGVLMAHITSAIALFFLLPHKQMLLFLIANIITVFLILELYRLLFHLYLFRIKPKKNILIIGSDKRAKLIADEIINKKALMMKVVGFIQDPQNDEEMILDTKIPIYKTLDDINKIIKENKVDIVIVAIQRRMEESILTSLKIGIPRRVRVYKLQDFYELVTGKYYVDRISINELFYTYMNKRSLVYDVCKRTFDIIASAIILLVTCPILIYIGMRVKRTDGGAAIYTQNRVGQDGKVFKAYKLRTMYLNDYVPTSENLSNADKQDSDDRVIPFCRFVRKARFDEIPQMVNILKGEMSIVGPRTEWEDLVKVYSEQIPYHNCRHWVKTGWTGWAQINQGHLFSSDAEAEKLQYDLYYLKHRNVFWEICILVKAVFLALGGRHG